MTTLHRRAGLALAASACLCGPLQAQAAKSWCKIVNHSNLNYSVAISDTVAKSGVFFLRPSGTEGHGVKLDKKGDSFVLEANKSYDFNYDTTGGTMAATLKFADPTGKYTELNFKFLEAFGKRSDVRIGLTADDWTKSKMEIHLSGCFAPGMTFISFEP